MLIPQERKIAQAQHEWGRGSVQRSEAADRVRELEEIAAEPFARLADDPKLERMRKELVRDGDPMAAYVARRGGAGEGKVGPSKPSKPSKPEYAGPAAPPNRFTSLHLTLVYFSSLLFTAHTSLHTSLHLTSL